MMNAKYLFRAHVAALCLLGAMASFAGAAADSVKLPVVSAAQTGAWIDSFPVAKDYAFSTGVPLVMVWSNDTCDHCNDFKTSLKKAEFTKWQRAQPYVFCLVEGKRGNDTAANKGAKAFARNAGGYGEKNSGGYPMVALLWLEDEEVRAVATFTGRPGTMGVPKQDEMYKEFIAAIEATFAGYSPVPEYAGGDLAFSADYAHARLEAVAGFTDYVDVPLVRTRQASGVVGTNLVSASFGGAVILDEQVVWSVQETSRSVRVAIPAGAVEGDIVAMTLKDADGAVRGAVNIHVVGDCENTPKNPLFIGERTVSTLDYGEWTMDLDVAMAKYKAEGDSKLLALIGGSMWCPDCVMADLYLLDRKEFKTWAVANKVILVDIDIPNLPNTTNSPSLLTRILSRASDGYVTARNTRPADESERYQSGAGYLSRHMVSDAAAAKVAERNARLVGTNRLNGGWNDPDRANQSRTGVPVFFALNRDGSVAGCLDAFSSTAPKSYNAAYLNRLDELLAMADSGSGGIENSSWQTTTDIYAGTGENPGATLTPVNLVNAYRLGATTDKAAMQTIVVKGTEPGVSVTARLLSVIDGVVKAVAVSSGELASGVTVSGLIASTGSYFLEVKAAATGVLAIDSDIAGATVSYALDGEREEIANPFSNDWISLSLNATLPLFSADGKSLAGTLTLVQKKSRLATMVTAKYNDGSRNTISFSGKWNEDDIEADGTVSLLMIAKNGCELLLTLHANGVVEAELESGLGILASGECGLAVDYKEFVGNYVVALLPVDGGYGDAYAGVPGYMTLKMASGAAAKSGKFSFSVRLPDGKALSGSTGVVWLDADFGIMPIFKVSGTDKFSAVVKVRCNASTAPSSRAVVKLDGIDAGWESALSGVGFSRKFDLRGSYYNKGESLLKMADISGNSGTLMLAAEVADIPASETYGNITAVAMDGMLVNVSSQKAVLAEKSSAVKFSLNRSTGLFSGKTNLTFENEQDGNVRPRAKTKAVAALYYGVVLPDWYSDCSCSEDDDTLIPRENLPFGIGFCVFSDRVGRTSVKRSFAVGIGSAK